MCKKRIEKPAEQLEFAFMSDKKLIRPPFIVMRMGDSINDCGTLYRNNTLPLLFTKQT